MKNIIYYFLKYFGFLIPNSVFCNLIFIYNCIRFKRPFYWLDIKNPKTFNEKINHIKFYKKNHLGAVVADKIAVRKYVESLIGRELLIPNIGTYNKPSQIRWGDLPEKFVMKINNGSGANIICPNIENINLKKEKIRLSNLFKKDYYLSSREWQYKEIKNQIIIEQFLGDNLNDYKVFCSSNDGPFLIQVDSNRFNGHRRDFFDTQWHSMDIRYVYPKSETEIPRPKQLTKMLEYAKTLSQGLDFARIDFFEVNGQLYFGEITLHPEGGFGPFDSFKSDLTLGSYLPSS